MGKFLSLTDIAQGCVNCKWGYYSSPLLLPYNSTTTCWEFNETNLTNTTHNWVGLTTTDSGWENREDTYKLNIDEVYTRIHAG